MVLAAGSGDILVGSAEPGSAELVDCMGDLLGMGLDCCGRGSSECARCECGHDDERGVMSEEVGSSAEPSREQSSDEGLATQCKDIGSNDNEGRSDDKM